VGERGKGEARMTRRQKDQQINLETLLEDMERTVDQIEIEAEQLHDLAGQLGEVLERFEDNYDFDIADVFEAVQHDILRLTDRARSEVERLARDASSRKSAT
jgi:archaellum component FlaC